MRYSVKLAHLPLTKISLSMQVIEYVQYLQEKVQKYEGSYQNWSGEPTKLIPWVNTKCSSFIAFRSFQSLTCLPALFL